MKQTVTNYNFVYWEGPVEGKKKKESLGDITIWAKTLIYGARNVTWQVSGRQREHILEPLIENCPLKWEAPVIIAQENKVPILQLS